jgi:hypothetical protein
MYSEILLVKLLTGEELIATVVDNRDEYYILDKPFTMQIVPTASGQVNITMIPWFLSSPTGGATLQKRHIIGQVTEPNETLKREYLSRTSGIQIAPAGILNG